MIWLLACATFEFPEAHHPLDPAHDYDADGFSEDEGDCDDEDAERAPGRFEVCGDGTDQDCDDLDPDCRLQGDLQVYDAWWAGTYGEGLPAAFAGDQDGDGADEIVVGTQWNSRLYFLELDRGTHEGLQKIGYTDPELDHSGHVVVAGDLTGDGQVDVVFDHPGHDDEALSNPGAVWVIPGPIPTGQVSLTAARRIVGEAGASLGDSLATLDADGDGQLDLLVGARDANHWDPGAAYLIYGPIVGDLVSDQVPSTVDGRAWFDDTLQVEFGAVSAGLGDVDGDGTDELAVTTVGLPSDPADVRIALGGPRGNDVSSAANGFDHVITAPYGVYWDDAEHKLAVHGPGDLNGDGYDDVVIGLANDAPTPPGSYDDPGPGGVSVFYGPLVGDPDLADADVRIYGEADGDWFGMSLSHVDSNGDGRVELLVGAPYHDDGGGAVYLIPEVAPGSVDELAFARLLRHPARTDAQIGWTIDGGGDADGDGYDDVLVSAQLVDNVSGGALLWLGGVD